MAALLQCVKGLFGPPPPPGQGVIPDLEYAMLAKGGLTQEEDIMLQVVSILPTVNFGLFSGLGSYMGWFGLRLGDKLLGGPPCNVFARIFAATGCAYIMGKGMYGASLQHCSVTLLDCEGRMKTELANIILAKHSDDVYLVKAVKRHFFAEHLFDELHQDQPLFRWHPRHSYTDSAFVERMKEIETINSDNEARSVSREATADKRPSGELMEDSLSCILGSPGDVESNNTPRNASTVVLKRSQLRARRRSHRHHRHRHADDKFAAS